jgi:enamine deaminase RidA (YjgF/YER057c/UK114 family)
VAAEREIANFGSFMEGDVYGFAQAVKSGDTIYVSGQTAMAPDGKLVAKGDMEGQMREAYANIARILAKLGASLADVVDETLYVADMNAAVRCAGRVRKQVYGGRFALASSLVGVAGLGSPDILIEIKCTARV